MICLRSWFPVLEPKKLADGKVEPPPETSMSVYNLSIIASNHYSDSPEVGIVRLVVHQAKELDSSTASAPSIPPIAYVTEQITLLRQRTDLPLVFTIRTASQGGQYPDHANDAAFQLFYIAVRLGVEYIDVETSWPPEQIRELVKHKIHAELHERALEQAFAEEVAGERGDRDGRRDVPEGRGVRGRGGTHGQVHYRR